MADAASSVAKHFNGNMVFINVMKNISIDQALENKADKVHTHSASDITDLGDNVDGSMDSLVGDLTDAILDL